MFIAANKSWRGELRLKRIILSLFKSQHRKRVEVEGSWVPENLSAGRTFITTILNSLSA